MAHSAKRIAPGLYHYRGHEIEEVGRYDDGVTRWNITEFGEDSAHDAENTLRQAKNLIDFWIANR